MCGFMVFFLKPNQKRYLWFASYLIKVCVLAVKGITHGVK